MSDNNKKQENDRKQEPSFNILPHPANTNNPADLNNDPGQHGGLQAVAASAYNAKGPHIPSGPIAESLEKQSREELRAEAKELNS
ncbi:hypothetical protein L204_103683 [Cryptococcus depauperatus]|nr:hypothetical protein L204_01999 [Cryptococcus depauperatus CBS 7855]